MGEEIDRANAKPEPVDRLSLLWRRLSERKIAQWSIAYIALAYGIQHGVVLTGEAFEWPRAVERITMLLLALGLPVTMTFAWYHGERASRRISGPELTIISILLAIGSLFFYVLVKPGGETLAGAPALQQASIAAARSASLNPRNALSVAVLPFENLSGDAAQEFFSDGMTEEIMAALAKIPDLRVVARGSSSQFKGEKKDLRSVGQALGATHLIEGSVRKAGNRVRITAQLVKADDGVNVWVNSYDREMTDVFAIQEDIATAIAGALRMPLGLKPGEQLVSNRGIDAASYEQYLRAKALLLRGRSASADAIAILEPLVARNPNYAPAWVRLAQAYNFAIGARRNAAPEEFQRTRTTYEPKRDAAAHRALELDPNSVEAQIMQAATQTGPRRLVLTETFLSKALALDPNNPDALEFYSDMLLLLGRVKESVPLKQQLHELEPFIPVYDGNRAEALWLDGQTDAAIAILKDNLGRAGAGAGEDLARIYASLGRYMEAADVLSKFPGNTVRDLTAIAAPILRSAPAKAAAPEKLPPLGSLGFIYLYVGAPERALDYYEQAPRGFLDIPFLWHPSYAALRKTDRFKKIVREAGLVDYWRKKSWPSFCHTAGADDFACE